MFFRDHYLFSYGSNSPRRLEERLECPLVSFGAYAEGWARAFRGMSKRWEGGVATLVPDHDARTYGNVVVVGRKELEILDRVEDVPRSYTRQFMTVTVVRANSRRQVKAYVYLAQSRLINAPSRAYVDAIVENINTHWRLRGRLTTAEDIKMR